MNREKLEKDITEEFAKGLNDIALEKDKKYQVLQAEAPEVAKNNIFFQFVVELFEMVVDELMELNLLPLDIPRIMYMAAFGAAFIYLEQDDKTKLITKEQLIDFIERAHRIKMK